MMEVIDPHVHMWSVLGTPREASTFVRALGWAPHLMHWLAPKVFPGDAAAFFGKADHILADYGPAEFAEDAQVDGFVHVEASWKDTTPLGPVDETRWLEQVGGPKLLGIVGYADLMRGADVREVLRAHKRASPRFRGIRYALAHHDAPGVLDACPVPRRADDPHWRRGFEALAEEELGFDATVYHHQLGDIARLAADFPHTPIVVDHAGTPVAIAGAFGGVGADPRARERIAKEWREAMVRLAEQPNVVVKISGLAMPVLGADYASRDVEPTVDELVDDLGPMVEFVIDTFGAERCMFASNFPIEKVAVCWPTLDAAFRTLAATRSDSDQEQLFSGTARRTYRL